MHLDGDLAREAFDREACEPLGYGFVSDDSLHNHLRECATCQTALRRARRLDAALASMAGRAVADQVAASGCSLDELSDQWLDCAAMTAAGESGAGEARADEVVDVSNDLVADESLDWLFDRVMQHPGTQNHREGDDAEVAASFGTESGSRTATGIAIAGVLAACLATWLCISQLGAAAEHDLGNGQTLAHELANQHEPKLYAKFNMSVWGATATPPFDAASPLAQEALAQETTAQDDPADLNTAAQNTETTEPDLAPRRWHRSLARSLHAARNRELPERLSEQLSEQLPEQRTARPEDLSHRVRNRALSVPERLAAAQRLLRGTRAGSSAARHATDQLLLALAGCGDLNQDDIALHEQLLDEVRSNGPVLVRLEHRLVSLPSRNRDRSEFRHKALAAILVAARVENARLDQAIRRSLRRNDAIADVVAGALRCGVRANGTTQLLLDCWHDQVAIGKQENTPEWAEFWFRGQAATSFAQLAKIHADSHSAPERVRCLLAMGCVPDSSTLPALLAELVAPRRVEACAAACGLASLPHRVLKQLLGKAKLQNAGLLRAALARAGMPQANRWIQTLALSKPQLRLMRTGPITRFSEVAAWFRNGLLTAD